MSAVTNETLRETTGEMTGEMTGEVRTITSAEREIYRDYERKRRLRLASILLPIFAIVETCVFLVSASFLPRTHYASPIEQIFIINTGLLGVCALLQVIGIRFVRRGQVTRATLSVILPVGAVVVVPILVYDIAYRFVPYIVSPIMSITLGEMVATLILIVLAGVLATNRWILVGTTLAMNVFTIFILVNALQISTAGAALSSETQLFVSFPIFVQWATAGILIATTGTYLQTLRELGDVRVAYQRARQLDELKDQFISHVNHELRSPIMALHGHVELLLLTEGTLSREERHTYLERAKRAGDGLVSLVTSILDVRKLEHDAENFTPEAVDVREALEAALRLVDPHEGKGIERELRISMPTGLAILGEPVRLRQIFTNLLSNAVKYSAPGTPITVDAQIVAGPPSAAEPRQRRRPRVVEITVRDHGLGIPPDQLPLLFNRFARLPRDLASNVSGNGLGLYLCHSLAQVMGGRIWAESSGVEGEGSAFHLQLPLAALSPAAAVGVGAPASSAARA